MLNPTEAIARAEEKVAKFSAQAEGLKNFRTGRTPAQQWEFLMTTEAKGTREFLVEFAKELFPNAEKVKEDCQGIRVFFKTHNILLPYEGKMLSIGVHIPISHRNFDFSEDKKDAEDCRLYASLLRKSHRKAARWLFPKRSFPLLLWKAKVKTSPYFGDPEYWEKRATSTEKTMEETKKLITSTADAFDAAEQNFNAQVLPAIEKFCKGVYALRFSYERSATVS